MFSQYNEDDAFLPLLANIKDGFMLDIGAWNAKTFSNSRALIERGWHGVLVEPSPGPVEGLVKEYAEHPNVTIIAAAISIEGGFLDLEITDDAVSQPKSDRMETWRSSGGFYGKLTVPAISVEQFCHFYGGAWDCMSIDTEGTSVDIFREFLRIGPRPAIAIVEHDDRIVELSQYAEQAGYRQVTLNGTNWVGEWQGRTR